MHGLTYRATGALQVWGWDPLVPAMVRLLGRDHSFRNENSGLPNYLYLLLCLLLGNSETLSSQFCLASPILGKPEGEERSMHGSQETCSLPPAHHVMAERLPSFSGPQLS